MRNQVESFEYPEAVAIAELAKGTPQRAIAAQTGISQPVISRINTKHKELIQAETAKLVEQTLSKITGRAIKEIKHVAALDAPALMDKDNQQALARIDKKEEMILKSVGIAPSHAPSIHVQQIFNDNRKTILSPVVSEMFHGRMGEIIDGEIVEDE
jgi:hypothetical protein